MAKPKLLQVKVPNAKVLKEGDRAPDFELESDSGEKLRLKSLQGRTVVLYFYPKDMTSGCTREACDFNSSLGDFRRKGAVILGVSRDSAESHRKFKEKHELGFALLSDSRGEVCEAYGVWKQKSMYGRKYMGIERTTFVISPEGRIARIFPKVKVTGHSDAVLAVCKA
ncbi:MAG: thioredoxin-dependent thiol peroxidase [Oligoflexia bacterium]|nr:thioredoxin-dependent thiol peroxidase [Oligoflexia bacterium]